MGRAQRPASEYTASELQHVGCTGEQKRKIPFHIDLTRMPRMLSRRGSTNIKHGQRVNFPMSAPRLGFSLQHCTVGHIDLWGILCSPSCLIQDRPMQGRGTPCHFTVSAFSQTVLAALMFSFCSFAASFLERTVHP